MCDKHMYPKIQLICTTFSVDSFFTLTLSPVNLTWDKYVCNITQYSDLQTCIYTIMNINSLNIKLLQCL